MSTAGADNNNAAAAATAGVNSTNTATTVTKDAAYGTKKYGEPLFGPSIGSVSSGPGWTMAGEKKVMTDELTTEIVNGWIEKSKETSNPTTTLQALVNLKRPTLRLSPLTASVHDDAATAEQHLHLHGLEFSYDCDAPKCGVHVYVHLSKDHPDAPPTHASLARLQVFEMVKDGGFDKKLTIEDGAFIELERFEFVNGVAVGGGNRNHQTMIGDSEEKKTSDEGSSTIVSHGGGDGTAQADVTTSGNNNSAHDINNSADNGHRRRFSHFHFRKLHLHRRISGPALTVVDAERNPVPQSGAATDEAKTTPTSKTKDGDGVKVTIRLVALDEQGMELASPNEQLIYLQIVREGTKSDEDDKKPWVVKVVKREAMIGPHTFHLHEIYGLSSSGAGTTPASHTYPPDASGMAQLSLEEDEPLQSECLLCLSSPKEVVLLPCRHLVACKECALNMVEYGAGGNITYGAEPAGSGTATEETGGSGEGNGNGNGTGTGTATASATTPAVAVAGPRRKRKAKGWFCPVCREPYTSMLRLTTAAPPVVRDKGDGDGSGTEDEGEMEAPRNDPTNNSYSQGDAGLLTGDALVSGGTGFFRNGFLRTLSGLGRERPGDVENQTQTPSSGI